MIDYGPAPNDCDITPLSFGIVWVLLTFVLPKLFLDLGVIS